jgi:hypothetical protein
VEKAVHQIPKPRDIGFEYDDATSRYQYSCKLLKREARIPKVVKDVKEDQVGHTVIRKGKVVCVFYLVNPGVGKEVGSKSPRIDTFEVPDSRADLDDTAR